MDRRALLKTSLLAGVGAFASQFVRAEGTDATLIASDGNIVLSEKTPLLLNFNENSLGMSPKAKQAIIDALPTAFRYPDLARAQLIDALAVLHQVNPKQITLGNGSSETIQAVIQALAMMSQKRKQTLRLIVPDPTFNYAEIYANSMDLEVIKVPLKPNTLAFDLDAMQALSQSTATQKKMASVVYICNPNNPTATLTDFKALLSWMRSAPDTFFIIDEAYAEYVQDPKFISAIEAVRSGLGNVLVVRTFSKIHALAGLRIGYGIGDIDTINHINQFVSFDNTNVAAAVAASASLQDAAFIQKSIEMTNQSRQMVMSALDTLNLHYLPSHGNFIFHQVRGSVKAYQAAMKKHHIFVGREFPPATGWSRLTLGTPSEMAVFIETLQLLSAQKLA